MIAMYYLEVDLENNFKRCMIITKDKNIMAQFKKVFAYYWSYNDYLVNPRYQIEKDVEQAIKFVKNSGIEWVWFFDEGDDIIINNAVKFGKKENTGMINLKNAKCFFFSATCDRLC